MMLLPGRPSSSRPALLIATLLALVGSLSRANSFVPTPPRAVRARHARGAPPIPASAGAGVAVVVVVVASPPTSSLRMNFTPPEDNVGGLREGKYILIFAMLLSVWLFSIPPEFRRARLCSVEDVALYPERHCTTFRAWREGVVDYYAKGGGVSFDFSVEGKE